MTFTAELARPHLGVTDPQGYHPLAPGLHYVAVPCELHIEVPLVQKYTKSVHTVVGTHRNNLPRVWAGQWKSSGN